ncbi:MAG: hypothetical protein SVY15_00415 [Halobacteriota archaeon]|nr:hypothetical protein [Halobacteriota archaeon]
MEERTGALTKKLCYLPISDLIRAYTKVSSLYGVPTDNYLDNLSYPAYSKVKSLLLADLKERCSEVQNIELIIKDVYLKIRDNQELINRNIGSFKIEPEDSEIFVNLNSYQFEQGFEDHTSHINAKIRSVKERIEIERERIPFKTADLEIIRMENDSFRHIIIVES